MAELSFTKAFLAQLDSKPVKLPANHVFDPRDFQARQPFTLPRLSDPPHPQLPKKVKPAAIPGSSKSITIHLKSARNPVLDITLDNVPLSGASIQDLKAAVQSRIKPANAESDSEKVPLEKIKILWKRKPVQGNLVTDALASEPDVLKGGKEVEFGIMILGGAAVLPPQEPPATSTIATGAEHLAGKEAMQEPDTAKKLPADIENRNVLWSESFWEDLEGFLKMRIKDEKEAARLRVLFKNAWESST
ncbi:predicted protein [Uncinocarpus reesii 1704]|uniref:Ubiquitin-like domain-containing protein n=1 Tax=Uncinocarpus reesii (strain UAMH 1704) TaxID=336963 RepID=C4JMG4_UNCRE|nr:uncharacterized protein UREG_04022 [Uncinocarpus reesii 1704]EEP79176.1 predicted protein [Uncinocarpus reesii 1704]